MYATIFLLTRRCATCNVVRMTTNTNDTIITTNANANANATRRNASHANCDHDATKNARAKCRRTMRALNTSYDALRVDPAVTIIDANALIENAATITIDEHDSMLDVDDDEIVADAS